MKSFATYIHETPQTIPTDQSPLDMIPPPVITMTRNSIRTYPNNINVALYYAKPIGKYFAVVFHT